MILILILVISCTAITKAQKVFSVEYASQADIKVFVADYESRADLSVYKVDYSSQAGKNDGNWFFVDYASQADVKIFFVDYASRADVCLLYTSPSPRDRQKSRMPSSA